MLHLGDGDLLELTGKGQAVGAGDLIVVPHVLHDHRELARPQIVEGVDEGRTLRGSLLCHGRGPFRARALLPAGDCGRTDGPVRLAVGEARERAPHRRESPIPRPSYSHCDGIGSEVRAGGDSRSLRRRRYLALLAVGAATSSSASRAVPRQAVAKAAARGRVCGRTALREPRDRREALPLHGPGRSPAL